MAVKATTRKSSASTEIVLGKAAQQIAKAVNELNNTTATITTLVDQVEDLQLQISNKEESIEALGIQYKEKERQLEVELDLNFKASTEKVVEEYLKSKNKVSVDSKDLHELRLELENSKKEFNDAVSKEVMSVKTELTTKFVNDSKLLLAENKAIEAQNVAKIENLTSQNEFLEGQVAKLYKQMDDERQASIERAKASSVGSINVTPQGR